MARLLVILASTVVLALPAGAQVDDFGSKINTIDYQEATSDRTPAGTLAYQNALAQVGRIQDLEEKEKTEGLNERQTRKLAKAYERAFRYLEDAIEEVPDWIDPRFTLASLQYNTGAYQAARDTFAGLLEIDPDDARVYHAMCERKIARGEQTADSGGG